MYPIDNIWAVVPVLSTLGVQWQQLASLIVIESKLEHAVARHLFVEKGG